MYTACPTALAMSPMPSPGLPLPPPRRRGILAPDGCTAGIVATAKVGRRKFSSLPYSCWIRRTPALTSSTSDGLLRAKGLIRCKKPPIVLVMPLTISEARRNGAAMASVTPATILRILAIIELNLLTAPSQRLCTKPTTAVTEEEKILLTAAHRVVKNPLTVSQFLISRRTPAAKAAAARTTKPIGLTNAKKTAFPITNAPFNLATATFNTASPAAIFATAPNKSPRTISTGPMVAANSATVIVTFFVPSSSEANHLTP
ncbi:MAG: hypothetical protein DDT21_02629 [Syntrophomonadaceae bacterium]|nr:hypothetical protein [Bacillota bacterium]